MNHNTSVLPDTRPYPTDPVKNDLLLYAAQLANASGSAQRTLAAESLRAQIHTMLSQNHYLGLSVAMSMAPNAASYQALLDNLDQVLRARLENEIQWVALPVIIVAGTNQRAVLTTETPVAAINGCLKNYPHTRAIAENVTWLPTLITAEQLSNINAGQWFLAKKDRNAAANFAEQLAKESHALPLDSGSSVHAVFALGYTDADIQAALNVNLQQAALPLMQAWQESLAQSGVTLFTNPLSPSTPLQALTQAAHTRLRMALDVFAANAIRAVRLQSPRVGVVMASQVGGTLLFGFNATDSQFELQQQVFRWPLAPNDSIELIQQNFLDLMQECRIENIRLLHQPVAEAAELPNYAQSLKLDGHNPLFGDGV